ncbi:uncharacterized protein TNCV_1321061 [Trichonephila clavipes]|nr:uncharacterized protein TNCV_1321061 [Trichonephila clavipes]
MALYRSPLTVTLWPSSFLKKDSTSPSNKKTSMGEDESNRPRRAIFSFITPSSTVRASYSVQKRSFIKALQKHRWFDEGELLDTMEKGGT